MKYLPLLLCGLLLTACEDSDFGDKMAHFVDQELGPSSRSYARAQLEKKWAQAFNDALVTQRDRLLSAGRSLEAMPAPLFQSGASDREVLAVYREQLALVRQINTIASILYFAKRELETAQEICTNREIFYLFGMDQDAMIGIGEITVPDTDWTIFLATEMDTDSSDYDSQDSSYDNSFFQSAIHSVIGLFGSSDYDKQKKIFDEAVARIPDRVIHGEEMAALSEEVCNQSYVEYRKDFEQTQQFSTEVESATQRVRARLFHLLALTEPEVLRIGLDRVDADFAFRESLLQASTFSTDLSIGDAALTAFESWVQEYEIYLDSATLLDRLRQQKKVIKQGHLILSDLNALLSLPLPGPLEESLRRQIDSIKQVLHRLRPVGRQP